MAKDLETKLKISADTKGAQKALDGVQKELKQTGKSAAKTSGQTSKLASSFRRLGALLAGYFGVRAFVGAIQGAADLEQQIDRVASVSEDYADRIADVERASKQLGQTTAFTGQQAAEGFEEFARAGIDVDVAIASMGDTIALATAESLGLGQAADIVTGNLKLWGDAGETATTITDKLKAGASNSRTSVEQLNRAMLDAGPVAKAMGLSLDETVAILGKFADAGFRSERGGTAMKIILSQLEDPASKARKALAELGFEGDDFVGMLETLEQAGPAGAAAIRAFGTEAGPALRAVLNQGSASIGELTDKIRNSEGAAKDAAEQMKGNLNGALTGLSSAWDGLKTALTSPLLEPLAEQVRVLSGRFQAWVSDGTIGRIGETLKATFEGAIKSVKAFLGSFDFQRVVTDIRAFVVQIGASLSGLRESFRSFRDTSSVMFNGVTAAWNLFTAGVKGAASVIVAALALVTAPIELAMRGLNKLGGVSDETLKKFQEMRGGLKQVAADFSKAANEDIQEMGAALGLVSVEAEQTGAALDTVGPKAAAAGDGIEKIGIASSITADELDALTAAGQEFGTEVPAATGKTATAFEKGAQKIKAAGTAIVGAFNVVKFEGWKTAQEIEQAFARMGIQTQAALDALAEQTRKDFETIRHSGEATAAGIEQAARQYIEAWKAAHGDVLPRLRDMNQSHADLYLAILEVRDAEELKGEAARRSSELGIAGTQAEIDKLRELQNELAETRQELEATEAANAARGGVSGSPGSSYRDRVEAEGDDQALAEFDRELEKLSNRTGYSVERQLDIYNSIADQAIADSQSRASAGTTSAGTTSTGTTSATTSSSRLIVVRMGDVAPELSDSDLADRVVAELERTQSTFMSSS